MTAPLLLFPLIPKRSQRCGFNQEVLEPGSEYYSVVMEDENGLIVRKDYCPTCWENSAKQEVLTKTRRYWKSKVPKKQLELPKSQNREIAAFELMREALASKKPEDQAEAFILSLFLARKRILYIRQQLPQADGTIMTIYEVAATEEMIAIQKLPLSQLEVVKVQQRIAAKLKSCMTPHA
jgi:hypothetical protein